MPNINNEGVCIGGPLIGKVLAYENNRYAVYIPSPVSATPIDVSMSQEPILYTKGYYCFRYIAEDIGIWVYEDMNLRDIIVELLNNYKRDNEYVNK